MQAPEALGYEQITDVSSSVGVTIISGVNRVLVHVEGQAVRWRDDGTAPDASIGMRLDVGETLDYDADGLSALRFIEEVAGATLNVTSLGST